MVTVPERPGLAVFRADASPTLGNGHVMRCLALAEALIAHGWRCGFAGDAVTFESVPQLRTGTVEFLILEGSADSEPAQLGRRWPQVDWLILDHYRRDAVFENACRPWARRILVIDDLADRPHVADCLLDATLGRRVGDYAPWTSSGCRFLLGPAYALLRTQFARARAAALERRTTASNRRLLISMGATDPVNATGRILDAIGTAGLDLEIDVALGSTAPHLETVRAQAARLPVPARVHVDVADMAGLMRQSDIAVGAGGGTAWERCVLALPSLVIVTGDDQRKVAAGLAQVGAIELLEAGKDVDSTRIVDGLRRLTSDRSRLVRMGMQAARQCDGNGVFRVVNVLAPQFASDGVPVWSRPASVEDVDLVFDWQSHPSTRRYFRNPEPPTRNQHIRWFKERCVDPACTLEILMHGDEPAGVLRLEPVGREAGSWVYEVSILVAPDHYRRGLGRAALGMVDVMHPQEVLRAEIHEGNTASVALFESAGYRRQQGRIFQRPVAQTAGAAVNRKGDVPGRAQL